MLVPEQPNQRWNLAGRGLLRVIVSDNGTEFTSLAILR
jgi:hypothetical protein